MSSSAASTGLFLMCVPAFTQTAPTDYFLFKSAVHTCIIHRAATNDYFYHSAEHIV